MEETLTKYIESVQIEESNMDIDQLFEDMFDENSIGTGTSDVAGAGSDETVMTPDAVKRYKQKNKSVKRFKDTI